VKKGSADVDAVVWDRARLEALSYKRRVSGNGTYPYISPIFHFFSVEGIKGNLSYIPHFKT
jgi:hypothetical protein